MFDRPSILITDDDRQFRETLCGALEPRGYRLLAAGDGAEAFDIVQRGEVHLLLLDMHMPRCTGLETVRMVKELNADLPCILMSARLDDQIRREAELAKVFSVMPKPVQLFDLNRTVQQALHLHKTSVDLVQPPPVNRPMRQRQTTIHLTQHPRGGDLHRLGLPCGRVRVSHAGV